MEGKTNMITFVTRFTVKGDPAEFERVFKDHSEFMRQQPGFVHFEFLRSARDPNVYVNIGRWESAEAQRRVVQSEEFQAHASAMRALVDVDADVYTTVADSGSDR